MEETIATKTTTMGEKKANPSLDITIRPRQSVLILYKNVVRVGHAEFFFEWGETEEEKDHGNTKTTTIAVKKTTRITVTTSTTFRVNETTTIREKKTTTVAIKKDHYHHREKIPPDSEWKRPLSLRLQRPRHSEWKRPPQSQRKRPQVLTWKKTTTIAVKKDRNNDNYKDHFTLLL